MATVAYSGHSRPPGDHMATFDGANTMPRRGLTQLVSKFETLDRATGSHRRQPSFPRQPLGLTGSKTMSSLNLFQDSRRYFEKPSQKKNDKLNLPKTASPVAAAVASVERRTSASTPKHDVAAPKQDVVTPKKTKLPDLTAASVAEKRRFFETDKSAAKDSPGESPLKQYS